MTALSHWLVVSAFPALVLFPFVPRRKYGVWQSGLSVAHKVPLSANTTGAPEAPEWLLAPQPLPEDGELSCSTVHDDGEGAGQFPGVTSHTPGPGVDRFDSLISFTKLITVFDAGVSVIFFCKDDDNVATPVHTAQPCCSW